MSEENKKQNNEKVSLEEITKELELCKKERDEYLDGWKRTKADFINYKNEEVVRVENAIKFGNESLLYDMLAVLDSLDLGIVTLEKDPEAQKGMKLIRMQCEDIMKKYGLTFIDAPPGTPFDPTRHEAIEEIASDVPEGSVAEEVKRGYVLNGKVLRPAKVKIAKKS